MRRTGTLELPAPVDRVVPRAADAPPAAAARPGVVDAVRVRVVADDRVGTDFAGAGFAGVAFAAVDRAGADLAAAGFARVAFAGVAFAGVALAGVAFAAVDRAGADFAAADFAGGAFAALGRAAVERAGVARAGAAFAAVPVAVAAARPRGRVVDATGSATVRRVRPVPVATVSAASRDAVRAAADEIFGSFFAPLTTSRNAVPGLNFGTDVFFSRTVAPVAGLRAVRAGFSRFSKEPNPVRTTRSPLATVRVIVSRNASTECETVFLSASMRCVMVSMSSDLFTPSLQIVSGSNTST